MKSVDYDAIASAYDSRYAHRSYSGTREVLRRVVGQGVAGVTVEIGCGTGHWLRELAGATPLLVGIDLSWEMLVRARDRNTRFHLVRGDAAILPFATASIDRVLCVNVLHHIRDPPGFLRECRRVLGVGGRFITIGLDPHTGSDAWWVYDYFPSARGIDLQRYPATSRIRELLTEAGFGGTETEVAEHLTGAVPFAEAMANGSVDRGATSQLMVISDADYESGLSRLTAVQPVLRTDLRLFATTGRVEGRSEREPATG